MHTNLKNIVHTKMIECIRNKKYKKFEKIISKNMCHVNTKFSDGSSVIHMAIELADLQIIKLLLKYKVNVDICNSLGDTPILHILRCYDDKYKFGCEMLAQFLSNGADVNKIDESKYTPLTNAVLMRQHEFVTLLLEHNANNGDYQNVAIQRNTILHTIMLFYHEQNLCDNKLNDDGEYGDDGDYDDDDDDDHDDDNVIENADIADVYDDEYYVVEDFAIKTYRGSSVKEDNKILIQILRMACVNPEIENHHGRTALQLAIELIRYSKINILLNYGIKFDYRNIYVQQYLQSLIAANHTKMIAFCLYHLVKRYGGDADSFKSFSIIPDYHKLSCYIEELQKMKNDKVDGGNGNTTYFDVLTMNFNRFAFMLKDCECRQIYSKVGVRSRIYQAYPLFGAILFKRIQKVKLRSIYIDVFYEFIVVKIIPPLVQIQTNIIYLIFGLLENKDFLTFIRA